VRSHPTHWAQRTQPTAKLNLLDAPLLILSPLTRWASLTSGQRMTATIIAMNATVFLAWRFPGLRVFMERNFVHSPLGGRVRTMVTAGFSHEGGFHFLANMYGLYLFMPMAASVLGAPQTLFVYLSGTPSAGFPWLASFH